MASSRRVDTELAVLRERVDSIANHGLPDIRLDLTDLRDDLRGRLDKIEDKLTEGNRRTIYALVGLVGSLVLLALNLAVRVG